jgi:hypothetical protein
MARMLYCWRCKMDVPMLDEQEWGRIEEMLCKRRALLDEHLARTHRAPLEYASELKEETYREALALHSTLTGSVDANLHALWQHRLALYGPPCAECGKPLRTPAARRCFACGAPLVVDATSGQE